MQYFLGFMAGVLFSILVIVTLAYFRNVIEKKITIIQKQVENAGPRPRGFIVEPKSDAEEVREAIIRNNQKMGIDTPIRDLL